jgi:hypothetical protein
VATGRLALAQTAALAAEGALEPLWTGPAGPVLAAGEARGQRVAVFAFAPERSENLPLSASYPLLLGNAIHWATQPKTEALGARCLRTGEPIAPGGTHLAWIDPAGRELARTSLRHGWATLDRIGLWQSDGGQSGSAALLSPRETLLPASATEASAADATRRVRATWLRGDLSTPLLALVLLALLVESWLFHRHAVY